LYSLVALLTVSIFFNS